METRAGFVLLCNGVRIMTGQQYNRILQSSHSALSGSKIMEIRKTMK